MVDPKAPKPTEKADPAALMGQLLSDLSDQTGIERTELNEMMAAVARGEAFYEYLGASVGVLAAIENAAVTLYSSHRYSEAENIFRLLALLTSGQRASAYRGIGACRQVDLDYDGAIANYVQALTVDAGDLISAVYLGECLLITDHDEPAWNLLTSVLEDAERSGEAKEAHIKRAAALLAARTPQASTGAGSKGAAAPAHAASTPPQPPPSGPAHAAQPGASPAARSGTFGPSRNSTAIAPTRAATTGAGTATAMPPGGPMAMAVPKAATPAGAPRTPAAAAAPVAKAAATAAPAGKPHHQASSGGKSSASDQPAAAAHLPAADSASPAKGSDAALTSDAPYEPEFDHDLPPEPRSADPEVVAFLARPHVRERLDMLSEMYRSQAITLRDIADFSQEQVDAGYAVCYALLEQGKYAKCLEMCGWMLHIDSHDARFYQAAGLCAMNIGLNCLAEYLFASDTIWRKNGPDAATLIYKGESLLKQEELAEGLELVAAGLRLATGKQGYGEIVKRGQLLQAHYSQVQAASK